MSGYPKAAEPLLSVAPDDYVAERTRLARELKEAGHNDDAAAVAALRKPAPVVLAANHAARRRPLLAKDAVRAAKRVKKTLGLDAEARKALDDSLGVLEEVAQAFLGSPSEATRRRLHDLFQNVVADDDALAALSRGILTEEPEPAGFAAYTGARLAPRKPKAPARGDSRARDEAAEKRRRQREHVLVAEVASAEERLEDAREAETKASRRRAAAERELESARAKLERFLAG
jgi:hypothetical protein